MAGEKRSSHALDKASRQSARAPHLSKPSRRCQASSANCISFRLRDQCSSPASTKIWIVTRFAMRTPRARHGHTDWIERSGMFQTVQPTCLSITVQIISVNTYHEVSHLVGFAQSIPDRMLSPVWRQTAHPQSCVTPHRPKPKTFQRCNCEIFTTHKRKCNLGLYLGSTSQSLENPRAVRIGSWTSSRGGHGQ